MKSLIEYRRIAPECPEGYLLTINNREVVIATRREAGRKPDECFHG